MVWYRHAMAGVLNGLAQQGYCACGLLHADTQMGCTHSATCSDLRPPPGKLKVDVAYDSMSKRMPWSGTRGLCGACVWR